MTSGHGSIVEQASGSRITGKTRLIGLFGSPVSHSRSPVMQNSVFEAMGLDYAYLAFDIGLADTARAIDALRLLDMRGANVTMPLKRAVIPHLDRLSPSAQLAGAVNVIVNDGGVLTGHITDGTGFMLSLAEKGIARRGQRMVLLGAGGAAIAVAIEAATEGMAAISLFNRRDDFHAEAERFAAELDRRFDSEIGIFDLDDRTLLADHVSRADILVNATPVGMEDTIDRMALPDTGVLRPDLVVCDLIYVPRETRLLREAAARGCVTVSGIGMQLYQAAPAFEMWTGRKMDIAVARRALFSGA